jgi:uncharacterized repeat protein (TIGR04052 family)
MALVGLLAPLGAQDAPVQLRFRAAVGAQPFACTASYLLGTPAVAARASDFRFYVHDVRLVRADGAEVPMALDADGLWSDGTVALLDFEDATGPCSNGTPETRDVVAGRAPAGEYRGVRFTLGVPFERNHADVTTAGSPLSLTRLFWSWNAGYKFLRIDLRTESAKAFAIHLGSTRCTPTGAGAVPATACVHENRARIALDDLDPSRDVIVADLAELVRGVDLEVNQEKTAMGCMSAQNDADCGPLFAALGLPFPGHEPAQRVFRRAAAGLASAAGARAPR